MPETTVAIIGAGIGGVYLAADLGMRGCQLRLHDRDDSRLADIRARGGLDVEGDRPALPRSSDVTTDLAAAVDGADVIAVCTGGTYQEGVARRPRAAAARRPDHPADPGQYRRLAGVPPRARRGRLPRRGRHRRDGQLPLFLLAPRADPHPADRHARSSCRSPRFPATASTRCSPVWRRCFRPRSPRRPSSRPASPTPTRCCTSPIASAMPARSTAARPINSTPRA